MTRISHDPLFCDAFLVFRLADSGSHANRFGTLGIWLAIAVVLVFYILPLFVYLLGVDAMKFVMAVLCGIGLLIMITIIAVIFVISVVRRTTPS
ncbi:DUF5391 family protein [Bacillus sp. CLL-7-23]|uniref:DUF5391 family protein n=1 Tax=Bacillus changyiensis TaxID=3004103 RepID=A0ABT4X7P2_9BACI|nr:DUF5391 family protein [Bacillus changyiensis]MDA7028308.1 DUF5391 family protein [Bacillus changyiensis]